LFIPKIFVINFLGILGLIFLLKSIIKVVFKFYILIFGF